MEGCSINLYVQLFGYWVSQLRNIPIEKIIYQGDYAGYEATVISKPGRTTVDDLVNSIPC